MGLHRSRKNVSQSGDDTLWKRAWAHFKHEWTSAVFVASLITIANLHFDWLKAFETYAYLAIGQLTAVGATAFDNEPRAAVVTIDSPTFEERYRERSPLNRCELKKQLEAIYDAKPDVLVLDVDISPTYLLANSCERDPILCAERTCEGELYDLIVKEGKQTATRTVLLAPFPMATPQGQAHKSHSDEWSRLLDTARDAHTIYFGDGELQVNYGVHIRPAEMSKAAELVSKRADFGHTLPNPPPLTLAVARAAHPAGDTREQSRFLDTGKLLTALELIPTNKLGDTALTGRLKEFFRELKGGRPKVVFVGGAYGADNVFLSAVGPIYGVEAHAAAFASDEVKTHHWADLVIDFILAMTFSLVIAYFWRRYFDARMDENPTAREFSKVWILLLVLSVIALVLFFSFWSFVLLMAFGLWLSPISVAIGMLIDSFVSGSVDQAVHKFRRMQQAGASAPSLSAEVVESEPARKRPFAARVAQRLPKALAERSSS